MRFMSRAMVCAVPFAVTPYMSSAQDAAPVVLTEPQAECIARNADTYLSTNRPVYVVVIPSDGDCQDKVADTQSLADKTTASGAGIGLKSGDSSGFIVMTREQIVCIKTGRDGTRDTNSPDKFRLLLETCTK
jgi:hypothetical protein